MPESDTRPSIVIDRDLCMGSGMCLTYASGTFALDGETKAVVVDPTGDAYDAVATAVEACPTGALSLFKNNREGA